MFYLQQHSIKQCTADLIEKNQLNTVLSYSNKEIMNKVKLSWRKKIKISD